MAHVLVDLGAAVTVTDGAVVSKVVHRGPALNVTAFALDAGEGISEHTAARPAVVEVYSGRLRFVVEGEELDLVPGRWLYMDPGAAHSLEAVEPTVMVLTLLRPEVPDVASPESR